MSCIDSMELPLPQSSSSKEATRSVFKYLTPHKIVILILIHAYCTDSVPAKYQAQVLKVLLHEIEVNRPTILSILYLLIHRILQIRILPSKAFEIGFLLYHLLFRIRAFTIFFWNWYGSPLMENDLIILLGVELRIV
jgi:hypothetical protein